MATILFQGPVLVDTMRVVDNGAGAPQRLVVEIRQPPDAMGGQGWLAHDTISVAQLAALLIGAHVIT